MRKGFLIILSVFLLVAADYHYQDGLVLGKAGSAIKTVLLIGTDDSGGGIPSDEIKNPYADWADCTCRKPTWENLTVANLAEVLADPDATIDMFTMDHVQKTIIPYGDTYTCTSLVARFMPEKFNSIKTQFELRRACQGAKKIAKRKVEEFNKCPCFRYSRKVMLNDYIFKAKKFELGVTPGWGKSKHAHIDARLRNRPEKYKRLNVESKSITGLGGATVMLDDGWDNWCSAYVGVPSNIEHIYMGMEEAEAFAKAHDTVYVEYKFETFNARNSYSDPRAWERVYVSPKKEKVLAVYNSERAGGSVCDLGWTEHLLKLKDKKRRSIRMSYDPCKDYNWKELLQ